MWKPELPNQQVVRRIIKLLISTQLNSTDQIMSYLKNASDGDIASALVWLRNEGAIACSNKRWWIRNRVVAQEFLK